MKRINCPYLGLKDDPTTSLDFPSPGNWCHQGRPIAPVKGTYQEQFCLTVNHTTCPLYHAAHPMSLPPAIAATSGPILSGRQVLVLFGIPAMVISVAALAYAWNTFGSRTALSRTIPNTGLFTDSSQFQLLDGRATPTRTPFSPLDSDTPNQTPAALCTQPDNWVTYSVNPTDSLFRLSVIYGVSVEQLQTANCMGENTVILPGQTIYVPYIPTNTPAYTDTVAPTITSPTNTRPPSPNAAPAQKIPTNTVQPPTETFAPSNTPLTPSPTSQPSSTPEPPNTNTPPVTATNPPTETVPTPSPATGTPSPEPATDTPPAATAPGTPPSATDTETPPAATVTDTQTPTTATTTDTPTSETATEPLPTATIIETPTPETATEPPPTATAIETPTPATATEAPPTATATETPTATATETPSPTTATESPPPAATSSP